MNKLKTILLFLAFATTAAKAQEPPFWNDVQSFKQQDSAHFPAKGQILFIGSSSFTKWTDVNDYFPGYHILNRAFGGSQLVDEIRYVKDVAYPYSPRQIVIYCGENDIAASDTVTSAMVLERFKTLYHLIREKFSRTPILYVSIKLSPSRLRFRKTMEASNAAISRFIKTQKNIQFVNIYPLMLNKDGLPMNDIFIEDNLHMNAKGYHIWQQELGKYLIKPQRR